MDGLKNEAKHKEEAERKNFISLFCSKSFQSLNNSRNQVEEQDEIKPYEQLAAAAMKFLQYNILQINVRLLSGCFKTGFLCSEHNYACTPPLSNP